MMILTVCTNAQLGQARLLRESVHQHHPDQRFVVALADVPTPNAPLPADVTVTDLDVEAGHLAALSARYTASECRAAIKPHFIRAAFNQFSEETSLLYLDPSAFVYQPLTPLFDELSQENGTVLLNPHCLAPPADEQLPDEKHLQNVGLFSSGLIGFRRCAETRRMLDWWASRTLERAHVDFCAGQCLDQLWLMHVPSLFSGVRILKNPGAQAALWNLPQRPLRHTATGWQVEIATSNSATPLLTADFLGLLDANEGLFQAQNRLRLTQRPDVRQLLHDYTTGLSPYRQAAEPAAYGQQPEPPIRRGWRRTARQSLHQLRDWINSVPVPPLHR